MVKTCINKDFLQNEEILSWKETVKEKTKGFGLVMSLSSQHHNEETPERNGCVVLLGRWELGFSVSEWGTEAREHLPGTKEEGTWNL